MISKKTKLFILGAIILLLFIGGLFLLSKNKQKLNNSSNFITTSFTPEFLTLEEKKSENINPDSKIQVIKRNERGEITVYKVIRNDNDIVNLNDIRSVR